MSDHVHIILEPPEGEASTAAAAISRSVEGRRRYTAFANARARVTGHLFQGRFGCVAMDDAHASAAVRYLAFNPVRARLSPTPRDWRSARAHREGRGDGLASAASVLQLVPRFHDLLELSLEERAALDDFETRSANGRPLGDFGRVLARKRPGRKKREGGAGSSQG
jgi:putative transposase